jgi:hypothetical protein
MADETPDGLPGWTLGGVRKHGMRLEAACKQQRCGHFLVFDLDRLIERFGADYPLPSGTRIMKGRRSERAAGYSAAIIAFELCA